MVFKTPPEERNSFTDARLLLHSLYCSLMNSGTKDVLPNPPLPPPVPQSLPIYSTFTKIESEQSETGSSCDQATFSSRVINQAGKQPPSRRNAA